MKGGSKHTGETAPTAKLRKHSKMKKRTKDCWNLKVKSINFRTDMPVTEFEDPIRAKMKTFHFDIAFRKSFN